MGATRIVALAKTQGVGTDRVIQAVKLATSRSANYLDAVEIATSTCAPRELCISATQVANTVRFATILTE